MKVENLRSPHVKVGGIVYFARMLDKIRLHARGELPEEYHANLGGGFDARCCTFLGVEYAALIERVKGGGSDESILGWCGEQKGLPGEEPIEIWNGFMTKRGWRDEATPILQRRLHEGGFADRADIETMFGFLDLDEGRDPRTVDTPL